MGGKLIKILNQGHAFIVALHFNLIGHATDRNEIKLKLASEELESKYLFGPIDTEYIRWRKVELQLNPIR